MSREAYMIIYGLLAFASALITFASLMNGFWGIFIWQGLICVGCCFLFYLFDKKII